MNWSGLGTGAALTVMETSQMNRYHPAPLPGAVRVLAQHLEPMKTVVSPVLAEVCMTVLSRVKTSPCPDSMKK